MESELIKLFKKFREATANLGGHMIDHTSEKQNELIRENYPFDICFWEKTAEILQWCDTSIENLESNNTTNNE